MTHLKINNLCPTDEALFLVCDTMLALEQLEAEADEQDRRSVEGITSCTRRRERLMWRRLLRQATGQMLRVEYAESGCPRIKDFPFKHISVSHCRDVVAVVASQKVCGVDVERKDRNFERVAPRYVASREWALCEERGCDRTQFLAAVWCAKETLYKMAHREGLDLRDDISIESIDLERGVILGRVLDTPLVELSIIDRDYYMIVYSY